MIGHVVRLIRVKHWIKNAFVLAPLVFSLSFIVPQRILESLCAFAAFCLASSFCYIINDILDREKDRLHPLKKNRPLASGKISVAAALVLGLFILAAALIVALVVNPAVLITVIVYIGVSLCYSFFLKHVVIIDVIMIAMGFVIRITAGALAIGVPLSNWLLLTTFFLSLFLGFGKRRHDLLFVEEKKRHRPVLEHYSIQLLDTFIIVSVALIIITYSLYTVDSETVRRFDNIPFIYTVPLVVYGIFRYLYLIYKKEGGGDPADIILKDPSLIIVSVLYAIAAAVILYFNHSLGGGG